MSLVIKQMSNEVKIRSKMDLESFHVKEQEMLLGEQYSYQIALFSEKSCAFRVNLESPLKDKIRLYVVREAVMDFPGKPQGDEDYITGEPGLMPDILVPLEEQNGLIRLFGSVSVIWVEVTLDKEVIPGQYPITLFFSEVPLLGEKELLSASQKMEIRVLPIAIQEQKTLYTQWFHGDCIAKVHQVPIYSEEHWYLLDRYIKLAVELGVNMILTPVITPPLDVNFGVRRACTQLVRITKTEEGYFFDFTQLKRWISLCRKNGVKYYEMAHLFSQWGLEYSPNILIWEDGVADYRFGWHVPAKDPSYGEFLRQFLPALVAVLEEEEIKECTYFHISDEPRPEHLENYRYARDLVQPLIGGCKMMDALSHVDFYEKGLVTRPVTAIDAMEPFLKEEIEEQWGYCCCAQDFQVGNRFLAMPNYRNRMLGLLIYKYGLTGFLHWGYNFYYSQRSLYEINPYVTTSADMSFPSGDPFTVYPAKDGAYPSIRGKIFKEALQDVELCRMLEDKIGKEKVIRWLEKEAGMELTFSSYPRRIGFLPNLMAKMKTMLKEENVLL